MTKPPPPNAFSFELRKKRGQRIIKSMPQEIDKIRKRLGNAAT